MKDVVCLRVAEQLRQPARHMLDLPRPLEESSHYPSRSGCTACAYVISPAAFLLVRRCLQLVEMAVSVGDMTLRSHDIRTTRHGLRLPRALRPCSIGTIAAGAASAARRYDIDSMLVRKILPLYIPRGFPYYYGLLD